MRPYGYKGHWDSDNRENFTRENEKLLTRLDIDDGWWEWVRPPEQDEEYHVRNS